MKFGALILCSLCCLLFESPAGLSAVAAQAEARTEARGIYLLGENSDKGDPFGRLNDCNLPWIDGLAARLSWVYLDRGVTGPAYRFGELTNALHRAGVMGKKISILIRVHDVPVHVLTNAVETYLTVIDVNGHNVRRRTPCPWDAESIRRCRNFIGALAATQVDGVPLARHPALGPLRVGVIGRKHLLRENDDEIDGIPGYMRARFVDAAIATLGITWDAFPGIPQHYGCFGASDALRNPDLDVVVVETLEEFYPGLGRFVEFWTAARPTSNSGTGRLLNMPGGYVGFQALGSWKTKRPGRWTAADGANPAMGMYFAWTNYSALYFEIYGPDLRYAPFGDGLRAWHEAIWALPPPPP